jgi:zinc D-Ala-D-Ala carboxypeptidase
VSMDQLAAISQRIAEITSLVADPALAVQATGSGAASGSSGTASGTAFASALAEALAADGTTSATSLDGSSAASLLDGSGSSAGSLLDSLGLSGSGGWSSAGLSTASVLQALGLSGASGLSALGGSTTTSSRSGVAGVTGALGAGGVPASLAAYGNGRVPASALAPVGTTGVRMWPPAAQALTGLIAAAQADGVTVGVTDGYRSYAEQVSLAKTKGLYASGGLAAAPGTSEHGWGMAADLRLDPSALTWMRANGARFGFVETTPRESWHWAYRPTS